MTRRTVLAVAVALVALTAGCLGAATGQTGTTATDADGPTITTSGVGQVSTDPDRVLIDLAVVTRADTADEARAMAADRMDGLRSALADAGVTPDQISTTAYDLGTRYDRDGELDGFQATHAIRVELTDVTAAGSVVDAAVAGGANRVNGVTFTLSDEKARELRGQAIADAVEFARSDAEDVAQAAGVEVTGLSHASTSGGVSPVYYGREDVAQAGTSFEPGTVTVSVSVSATYAIE